MTQNFPRKSLKSLIVSRAWDKIVGMDPDVIVWSLSFDDALGLAWDLSICFADPLEQGPNFAVRLLYALKRFNPIKWKESWRHEAALAQVCESDRRYEERYYALDRARQRVHPMPGVLALELAGCEDMPEPQLVSEEEAYHLYQYALKEYPFRNALFGLRCYYKRRKRAQADEVERLTRQIDQMPEIDPNEPPLLPPSLRQTFSFDSPHSEINVAFREISDSEIRRWIESEYWLELPDVDPRRIIDLYWLNEVVRMAFRFLHDSPRLQDYAVRLLYAARLQYLQAWFEDWHYSALLGYACGLTRRYDEECANYFDASHNILIDPPELEIAMARCCLSPCDPFISLDQAIKYLKHALEEAPFFDALLLLKEVYIRKGDDQEAAEIDRKIELQRDKYVLSPSVLPSCINTPAAS